MVDDFSYLVNEFTQDIRRCFEPLKDDDPQSMYPNFLFGYKGKLYGIEGDYQIAKSKDKFDAVGSGADIAIGSLHSTTSMGTQKRIMLALEASALNNAAVRPPFHVMKLRK